MSCNQEAIVEGLRRANELILPIMRTAQDLTPGERRAIHEVVKLLALFQIILGALMAIAFIGGAAVTLCEHPRQIGPGRALFGFTLAALGAYVAVQLPYYARLAAP